MSKKASRPDPQMVSYLEQKGIEAAPHEARQIAKEDIDWADLILAMEKEHKEMIEAMGADAEGKVELLGGYGSNGPISDDIMDPFGMSSYHYRLSQAQIALAIDSLVKKMLSR